MGDYEKSICELYDNCPTGQQIKAIAGMYAIDPDDVKVILKENGRELPKSGRPKASAKNAPTTGSRAPEGNAPMYIPEAVKVLVFNRIDELDSKLKDLNQRIKNLETAKTAVTQEYQVLADYISSPFGAGNLSQNLGSDNMIESPQADA